MYIQLIYNRFIINQSSRLLEENNYYLWFNNDTIKYGNIII